MQQNAPFCILLKNNFLGGGWVGASPRHPTAFSLSRVGMYVDWSVVPARLGIHLSCRTTVIQDLLVRRQFSLVSDKR